MNERTTVESLRESVYQALAESREQAYRHALKHAGYLPKSIDLAVEANRKWIDSGKDKP